MTSSSTNRESKFKYITKCHKSAKGFIFDVDNKTFFLNATSLTVSQIMSPDEAKEQAQMENAQAISGAIPTRLCEICGNPVENENYPLCRQCYFKRRSKSRAN